MGVLRGILGKGEVSQTVVPGSAEIETAWTIRAVVEPDEVDGGFIAECVDLPGCMAQGETEQEALENLSDAIGGVVAVRLQSHLEADDYQRLEGAGSAEFRVAIPLIQ